MGKFRSATPIQAWRGEDTTPDQFRREGRRFYFELPTRFAAHLRLRMAELNSPKLRVEARRPDPLRPLCFQNYRARHTGFMP